MSNIEKLMNTWNEAALQQCTVVRSLPPDVAEKILRARDAITAEDYDEAWHWLYKIADPEVSSFTPWAELEAIAGRQ